MQQDRDAGRPHPPARIRRSTIRPRQPPSILRVMQQHTRKQSTKETIETMVTNDSDEWYTPQEVFDTLAVTFDLDVCAPVGGVPWIPASKHYTIYDNALQQPWTGRVWMNPPYSKPGPFVERWVEHGNGIMLIAISKSRWFGKLWHEQVSFAVPEMPVVKFVRHNERKQIYSPIAFVAIGPQENHDAIARIGRLR